MDFINTRKGRKLIFILIATLSAIFIPYHLMVFIDPEIITIPTTVVWFFGLVLLFICVVVLALISILLSGLYGWIKYDNFGEKCTLFLEFLQKSLNNFLKL